MKTNNKISPTEQLRMDRLRLQVEANTYAEALDKHVDYLQNNVGRLIANTAVNALAEKLPPSVRQFLPASLTSSVPAKQAVPHEEHSFLNLATDQAIDIIPMIFKGAKPVIIVFLLKQLKKLIISKVNKKQKAKPVPKTRKKVLGIF